MILPDINLLLYAHVTTFAEHKRNAKRFQHRLDSLKIKF